MLSALRTTVDRRAPGLAAVARRVRDEWAAAHAVPYPTVHGFTLVGDPGLDVSRLASGETEAFLRELAPASVLVDVGANVGLFTLLAARIGRPVLAVEPHPLNMRHLLRNVRDNSVADVEVYPVALSTAPGVVTLRGGGQGASVERDWGGIEATYETLVPATTLDRLLEGRYLGRQLLIKVDVEGHEHAVLRGALATLRREPRPTWLLEHGLTENFPGGRNPHFEAVFEAFWQAGYTARAVEEPGEPVIGRAEVADAVRTGVRPWRGLNVLFA